MLFFMMLHADVFDPKCLPLPTAYPVDIMAQCFRCYLAYSLSLHNLEEMMAERGIVVEHSGCIVGLSAWCRSWIRYFADTRAQ